MKKTILFSILFFLIFNVTGFSQSEEQIAAALKSKGITTTSDIQAELQKRNMTESDARKLAKQYGISYDEFIATYITGGKTSSKKPKGTKVIKPALPPLPPPAKSAKVKTPPKVKTNPKTKKSGLSYFGYNIFKNIPAAFKPNEIGPIDPGYIIGPGDVLQLYIWGAVQFQYQLTVDQQGNIFIPTAGQFFVSGITYKNLQKKLKNFLSKFYEGLKKNPPTVFLDVSLAKLRPIRIFVLGEVAQPGGYNISSYSTVFNALYSVGGPLVSGSLREIRVIRHNKVITKVDLYDYLLKGELIGDIRLQNNDIVFVPPRLKTVSISGEVRRPAIYELKNNENIKKLIHFAGGLKPTAYLRRVHINRIIPFSERKNFEFERKVIDINLKEILTNKGKNFKLYDGDKVTVFSILKKIKNFVTIKGAVYRPGVYELNKAPRISDLIKKAYGLKPEAYLGKADIIRTRPDSTFEFISFDLGKALNKDELNNVQLQPLDLVKIYSIFDLKNLKTVSISGYVKTPVTMTYADSITLYDMVFKAGGLEDPFFRGKAYLQRGDIIRFNPDGYTTRIIPFSLKKLLDDPAYNMKLEPGDKIYIYKADVNKVLNKMVTITGQVKNPGKYPLSTNMTVMDLILQAGGFLRSSLRTEAYVNRLDSAGYKGDTLSQTFIVKLPGDFDKLSADNFKKLKSSNKNPFYLKNKDIVVIRKNPDYQPQRTVRILGEVKYPGRYVLRTKNETLLELLFESGGPTTEAFLLGTRFYRGNKRLIVDVEKLYRNRNVQDNIILQPGDSIYIPKTPNTVFVTGEVNNRGLFKFIPGLTIKDYIEKAGGETDSADFIIYMKPTGETQKVSFGLFSSDPDALDGSVIFVTKEPPSPEPKPFDLGATLRDIFSIAASALTVIILGRRL